MRHLIVFNSKC